MLTLLKWGKEMADDERETMAQPPHTHSQPES